jgi:hypothetical protein
MEDLYSEHDKALDLLINLRDELKALTVEELLKASSSDAAMRKLIPELDEARTVTRAIDHSISLLEEDRAFLELDAENKRKIQDG